MKQRILVQYAFPKNGLTELFENHQVIYPDTASHFSENELSGRIAACSGLLASFSCKIDKRMIAKGKNLKIISNYGVGYNNIDVAFATSQGIVVTNTPDAVTEPTAELAMGLIISLLRRIPELSQQLRSKRLEWGVMQNLGHSVAEKTLGIIGMGRIGQALARRAAAAGMEIIYSDLQQLPEHIEDACNASHFPLKMLLETADVVSIHTPLNAETHHLIGKEELALMHAGSFLINTSRGAVVDEKALCQSLKNKEIAGAALDVFENEPEVSATLLKLDNVIAVPHIGTATIETRTAMAKAAADNLIAFFNGSTPPNVVNPEVLETPRV